MDYKVRERASSFPHGGVVTRRRQASAEILGWKSISRVTATGDAHLSVSLQAVCGLCVSAARLCGVGGAGGVFLPTLEPRNRQCLLSGSSWNTSLISRASSGHPLRMI